jgi:hypothetical protein
MNFLKQIWISFTKEEFQELFEFLTKLEALNLPEEAKLVLEEIRKILF